MMAERYIARSSAIAARLLGDEMMVMSTADSTFFTLNEVASVIWQAADGRTPLSEIVVGKICQEFDVDQEQAQRGADRFVDELSQHGILLVSDKPLIDSSASLEKENSYGCKRGIQQTENHPEEQSWRTPEDGHPRRLHGVDFDTSGN
jgi:hypothetical protein